MIYASMWAGMTEEDGSLILVCLGRDGWDPRLQTLLGVVEQTQKWRMLTSREMAEWRHPGGKFALLGDACHATLPYL